MRRIRKTLDFNTASTIATALVHSRLDYCNSLYFSLPSSQLKRLQVIQNSLARAVSQTPLRQPITPVLKSLHWLKVKQRIHYKLVSITHNLLCNSQPVYLRSLISIQTPTNTRSSSYLRLQNPKLTSRIKFHDRTFSTAAPKVWNSLPQSLRSFNQDITLPQTLPFHQLALSRQQFLKRLKTHLFTLSYPP